MSSSFIDWEGGKDDDDDGGNGGKLSFPLPLFPLADFSNELNSSSYFCCGRITKSFTFGIVRVEIKKE